MARGMFAAQCKYTLSRNIPDVKPPPPPSTSSSTTPSAGLSRFWHMPLLRNLDKSKISKRKNPVSLVYYRESGFLPEAMINFLGLMGGGMPSPTPIEIVNGAKENEIFSLAEMLQKFEVPNIRLGGPVFDLTK